jgi:signal transduction histidine kinase
MSAMRANRDVWLTALGVGGIVAGIAAVWVGSFGHNHSLLIPTAPIQLVVGWSFIGSGLASWRARPDNRLGPVMVATGFAVFVSLLTEAPEPLVFTLGELFGTTYLAGFLYVVLSFPSGRLRTPLDRALCLMALALVTVGQFAWLLFAQTPEVICQRCPANLLEIEADTRVVLALIQAQRSAGLVVTVVSVGLLGVRLVRASRAQRRAVILVLGVGIVALLALTASFIADVLLAPSSLIIGRIAGYAVAAVPLAVVVAFLQRWIARGAVAGLVVELGEPDAAIGLREALARALGDPSLAIGYWFAAESRFVDGDGQPVELPEPAAERQSTVVERNGQPVAVLIHDPVLEHNAGLVDSVCAAAGLTLENGRLQAELRARLAELQASRARLVEATEAERRRIERDLHDGTQQRLVSIAMSLGLLESKLPADAEQVRPIVAETRESLTAALAELRELTQGLRPVILAERGLGVALEELCRRASLPASLRADLRRRPPDQVASAAYFVVSEALANAAKHSYASVVQVAASCQNGVLTVSVEDDGIGGASAGTGTGLRGLADRVEALGGRLSVSSPPGKGTRLRAELPCE